MKILQLHTRYRQAGGEDAVVRAEAELLRAAGHTVVTYEVANPDAASRAAAALAFSAWNPSAREAVRLQVEHDRPDVAHVHNTWFALSPAVFAAVRQLGVPVISTLHNYRLLCSNGLLFRDGRPCEDCVGTHPWHGLRHRCYRGSAIASAAAAGTIAAHRMRGTWERDVDLFLALTEFARDRFIDGGLPADKIRVKPNFVPDPGPRRCAPQESDLVLYVGRLSPEKGIKQLIQAWASARPPRLRLLIVGDGPQREHIAALRAPGVEFRGLVSSHEVRRLMLSARALVFPSRWYETFGLVLVEAMAAGLAIVSTNAGGAPELLGPEPLPKVVPPDHAAWVAALRSLCDDDWAKAAGAQGRARYEQFFTPEKNLQMLETAYEAVGAHSAIHT